MTSLIRRSVPHLIVIVMFIVAALAYFHPVLSGKTIYQSDIVQYTGMAKQQNDFREATGQETYWTNSAFGGMPTYQLGARYPHNYIKTLDRTLRFLPRPADYLFLYFIGLYILFMVLKVDYRLAFIGSLTFGFSTYLIIILGVGHNAKAHAVAYFPWVISGVLLAFGNRKVLGALLLAVGLGLELAANHFQMTYYLLLLVVCIGVVYLVDAYKKKELPEYFKSLGLMIISVIFALGLNATNLLATQEYAAFSTRGKSDLSITADGTERQTGSGLSYDYITEYSYGKLESLNLLVPRLMGGGTAEPFPEKSEALNQLLREGAPPAESRRFLDQNIPMYWGDQPIVAAPAYVGAVVLFLALLSIFVVKGRLRQWLVAGFLLSLLLSWGKNLNFLTQFFVDYVPLYDKFRAVSSIQVLLEMIAPVMAVVGLHQFFFGGMDAASKKTVLLKAGGGALGLLAVLVLLKGLLFSFTGPYDSYIIDQMGVPFMDAVRSDRAQVLQSDGLRSLILVLLAVGALWLSNIQKIKMPLAILVLGLVMVVDLVGIDLRYVNSEDFVIKRLMERPFQASPADEQIMADTDHFRVYDLTANAFNSGRASYFHNALGGYHAAKPRRMQDLDDFYLSKGNAEMLSMLNVKYFIVADKEGNPAVQPNPFANGAAWFVNNVIPADDANQEILLLDSLNTKETAVINRAYLDLVPTASVQRDSTATIALIQAAPNRMNYRSQANTDQLAVFSELYYQPGWQAYIDDVPAVHFQANYLLRAMAIPAGDHQISFRFEPQVIATGSTISLMSGGLLILLMVVAIYYHRSSFTE